MVLKSSLFPQELLDLLRDRRVIPFIGAGFSAPLGLPDWDTLLRNIATELEDPLPFEEVRQCCSDNYLQIAEYYFLKSDGSIGPIRQSISQQLKSDLNPLASGAHVELLNLGAPQIYTTNYDDLIEKTFKMLHRPVQVVALPKHVATTQAGKTQIVKYHGDLRHEHTLVLTESSYYARLDFESPMDLKFRSDLLGRSVLFIGYSFRDINIRVIWFKLIRMMKDIPADDRPTSFIVRFSANPVLEKLYEAVGIKTIVLDPEGSADSDELKSKLLSEYMLHLAFQVSAQGHIQAQQCKQFVSSTLLDCLESSFDELENIGRKRPHEFVHLRRPNRSTDLDRYLVIINARQVPAVFAERSANLLYRVVVGLESYAAINLLEAATQFVNDFGPIPFATLLIIRGLLRETTRDAIINNPGVDWAKIWASGVYKNEAGAILRVFKQEIDAQEDYQTRDDDIVYAVDIASRFAAGRLVIDPSPEIVDLARSLLLSASELYPSVTQHVPLDDKSPFVEELISGVQEEFDRRRQNIHQSDENIPT